MRRFIALAFVVVMAGLGWILAPGPIDPAPFAPSEALPFADALAENTELDAAELVGRGTLSGPEDVAVDDDGNIYVGNAQGTIQRILVDGTIDIFATTGGHPLGLAWSPSGALIVCDTVKGLLSVDRAGVVTTLATEADGVPFMFTDDVDVARDGTIYFTDASSRYGQPDYILDLLESRPAGRFMRYVPSTGAVTVLLRDLYFANGVALSSDESFVLVNETWAYRTLRYHLTGEKAGTHDVFAEQYPGFPDGISQSGRGTFWLALFTVRKPLIDFAHPYPWLKKLVARLPSSWKPKPRRYGLVVELDEKGVMLRSMHDPDGDTVHTVTSAEEVRGELFLGTLVDDRIARVTLEQRGR